MNGLLSIGDLGRSSAGASRPRLKTPPPLSDEEEEEEEDYFEDDVVMADGGVDSAVYSEPVFLHETARVASMSAAASDVASDCDFASVSAASSVISRVQSEGGWMLHNRGGGGGGGGRRRRRRSLPTVQYRMLRTTSTGLLGWRKKETVVDCGAIVRMPSG